MIDALVAILREWVVWAVLLGAIIAWWAFGVLIARGLHTATAKPLASARGAALWSLVITVCVVGVSSWYLWRGLTEVVAVASIALLILCVVVFALSRFEPRLENE